MEEDEIDWWLDGDPEGLPNTNSNWVNDDEPDDDQ